MKKIKLLFTMALMVFAAFAVQAQTPLCTPNNAGNGQSATFFDVEAVTAIDITSLDVSFDALSCNVEVWTRPGSHLGNENSSAGWTMIASATITGNGPGPGAMPTPIPVTFSVPLNAGDTQGFHVITTNNTAQNYTNGTGTAGVSIWAMNADLIVYEGCGSPAPAFSGCTFSTRNVNACINYSPLGNPPPPPPPPLPPAGCTPFDLAGPFCDGCITPGTGSSLACGVGPNSIIQGIDVSGITGNNLVSSVDFNVDFSGATTPGNITLNLFCAPAAGPVPFGAANTPLYSETFPIAVADEGTCVTLSLATPPTIDPSCGTLWIEIVAATQRVVHTPAVCDGNNATGNDTYIVGTACGLNTPTLFSGIGFALDAGYTASLEPLDCVSGCDITCPADIAVPCEGSSAPTTTGTATSGPGCIIDFTDEIAGCVITRTWTATAPTGQINTCIQIVTLIDDSAPVISCPPSQTLTCFETIQPPHMNGADFVAAGGTIADNCTDLADFNVFSQDSNNGGDNCLGNGEIITRTYFVTDVCGNVSTCDQVFTYLESTSGPVITSILPTCFKYCASLANPMDTDITYDVDCSFGSTVNITGPQQNGPANCPGTSYTYTYTVVDDCGRVSAPATRSFIIGNDGPTIECAPFNLLLECGDPNNADYIAAHIATASANSSCELDVNITHFPTNFNNIPCNTSTVVTFIATDACGRTASCTSTINISDNTAPVITSTYVDGVCNEAECSGDVNFWFNNWKSKVLEGLSATDACDSNVSFTVSGPNTPNQDCIDGEQGVTWVTWTANDNCGNTSSIAYHFNVIDQTAPVFTFVPADGDIACDATPVFGTPSASDACNTHTITFEDTADDANTCSGSYTRTWTATDECGNASTAAQVLSYEDTEGPVISGGSDLTAECDGTGNLPDIAAALANNAGATASDVCGSGVTWTNNFDPANIVVDNDCTGGVITSIDITYTATDDCGNANDVTFRFDAIDTTPPVAPAAPADVNVQCASDVPAPVDLTAADMCVGDITVSPSAVITPGNCDNQFTMVRTWTFFDNCGNQSSVSQTINVNDTTPPNVPAAPADVNVQCASDVPAPVDLTANDNCDGDITVSPSAVITPGNCENQFTFVYTWTFVDGCGNQSSVSQTIQVDDTTAPEFTFVPADFESGCIDDDGNVTTYAQVCASSDDAEEDTDNGEMDLISSDLELIDDESQDKEVEVGIRFKDLNIPAGATITGAYIQFTVDATEGSDPSELEIHGQDSNNASTFTLDDEDISDRPNTSASVDWEPGDWEVIGDHHAAQRTPDLSDIVQEIVDRGGYTSGSALAFFITGTGKRTAISWDKNPDQAAELFVTYEGPTFGEPTADDNCNGDVTLTFEDTQSSTGCAGGHTRTWTATDICGNTSTASQTINFIDNVPPVFTEVPDHINIACVDATFPLEFGDVEVEDNCDDDVEVTFVDEWITGDANSCDEDDEDSEYRRTWTATDNCGNTSTAQQRYNLKESYELSGTILTENNITVENVSVSLEGFSGLMMNSQTAADGIYGFYDLELNANYTVTPALDLEHLNGVSSYDLVLITKHILQLETLDSPYKMIAADINNSGSITTMDLVELRKLILHVDESFTNNTSWRFVEANYAFPVPNNPFATIFPEEVFINGLQTAEIHDFVGVKIGDVNGSVVANALAQAEDRNTVGDLVFTTADQQLKAGQSYTVSFQADNFDALHGYQFTMNFDQAAVEFEGLKAGDLENMSDNNFGLALLEEGVITTSWTNQEATSLRRDANVFDLTFTAKADVMLSEVLSINSRYTNAEAYNADLELMNVDLRFDNLQSVANEYRLYQNSPNPFRQETTIGFDLPMEMSAKLSIFDAAGRQLKLVEGDFNKGYNQVIISKDEVSTSGVLYYQLVTESFEETRKMILN